MRLMTHREMPLHFQIYTWSKVLVLVGTKMLVIVGLKKLVLVSPKILVLVGPKILVLVTPKRLVCVYPIDLQIPGLSQRDCGGFHKSRTISKGNPNNPRQISQSIYYSLSTV